jgi:hypothetical protein
MIVLGIALAGAAALYIQRRRAAARSARNLPHGRAEQGGRPERLLIGVAIATMAIPAVAQAPRVVSISA